MSLSIVKMITHITLIITSITLVIKIGWLFTDTAINCIFEYFTIQNKIISMILQ